MGGLMKDGWYILGRNERKVAGPMKTMSEAQQACDAEIRLTESDPTPENVYVARVVDGRPVTAKEQP